MSGCTVGTHGTTYGGNPLACAAGNAVLDVMLAPGFLDLHVHLREPGNEAAETIASGARAAAPTRSTG